jgi:hypothetical protein
MKNTPLRHRETNMRQIFALAAVGLAIVILAHVAKTQSAAPSPNELGGGSPSGNGTGL